VPTLFTRIINREIPGTFVWADDECVAFLSIAPLTPGHTLVVPRAEIDQWTDIPPATLNCMTSVAQRIGQAQVKAFGAARAGLVIAGFEVPHAHIHVFPVSGMADFDFGRAAPVDPSALIEPAAKIRESLTEAGYAEFVSRSVDE
jgi:diadenosine tetraphosphate (Ap4A) HIT family hydrolase